MSTNLDTQSVWDTYFINKNSYIKIKEGLVCEQFKDDSLICGPEYNPSLLVSCSKTRDEDSETLVTSDMEVRYCDPIRPSMKENNDLMFSKMKRVLQKSNIVLLSDSVGAHSNTLGFHDTKKLWRWIEKNVDRFIESGLHTLAMEFIKREAELKPISSDSTNIGGNTIVPSSSSNVDEEDLEIIKSISRKINIIGIDSEMYDPSDVLENIYRVQQLATPENKIGVIVGSGYAKDICRDSRFDNFPSVFFEMFNLDRDFEPDEIHLIALFCEDYQKFDI